MITSQMLQKSECKKICTVWKVQVRRKTAQDSATAGVLAHLCLCGTLSSSTHIDSSTNILSAVLIAITAMLNID